MTLEIFPFEEKYADALQQMILAIQREEFGLDITLDEQPDLTDVKAYYKKGFGDFWLALIEGEIVGSVALIDIGNGQAALRKMFVKVSFRGKKHAIAQRLLDYVFSYSRDKSLQEILLGTTDKFIAAHRFYEKNNFTLVDVKDLPDTFPRMAVDTIFYSKRIVN